MYTEKCASFSLPGRTRCHPGLRTGRITDFILRLRIHGCYRMYSLDDSPAQPTVRQVYFQVNTFRTFKLPCHAGRHIDTCVPVSFHKQFAIRKVFSSQEAE